jgi:hypothetical protein
VDIFVLCTLDRRLISSLLFQTDKGEEMWIYTCFVRWKDRVISSSIGGWQFVIAANSDSLLYDTSVAVDPYTLWMSPSSNKCQGSPLT